MNSISVNRQLEYALSNIIFLWIYIYYSRCNVVIINSVIRNDLELKTVKEEIKAYAKKYKLEFSGHPNDSAVAVLMENIDVRPLKTLGPHIILKHLPIEIAKFDLVDILFMYCYYHFILYFFISLLRRLHLFAFKA